MITIMGKFSWNAASIDKPPDKKAPSPLINTTLLFGFLALAEMAKELKITKVYFDRSIYKYHGRVRIFAETLRKNGMEF